MRTVAGFDDYVCVRCGQALQAHEQELCCVACAQRYPVIRGIPVLLHRPRAGLRGNAEALEQCRADARAAERRSQWALADHPSDGLARRIERWRLGTAANLELMQRYAAPISAYLDGTPEPDTNGLLDFASSRDVGWAPNALLPYFHQDWCDGTGFEEVRARVLDAVARHCPSPPRVAVLGAGACGLAHALASRSSLVYGVDLCLPALLMAQAVMAGEALTISLEKAGWRAVDIRGPKTPARNVQLVQANVHALPFADASLSVVVTQYLLDLMGNPLALAREIRRVLAPGGIWINFSNPFPMPGEAEELGRPDLAEVGQLLRGAGWRVVDAQRSEFILNDVHAVDPTAVRKRQEVHFFVTQPQPQHGGEDHGRRWMSDPGAWGCSVANVPGVDLEVLRVQGGESADEAAPALLCIAGQTVPVPDELASSISGLFQLFDRGLTLEAIAGELEALGLPMSRTELRELIHYLSEHYGFIRLTEPSLRAEPTA